MTDKFMTNREILVFEDTLEQMIKNWELLDKTNLNFYVYIEQNEFWKESNIIRYEIVHTSNKKDLEPNGYVYIGKPSKFIDKLVEGFNKACEQFDMDPDSYEAEESDEVYNLSKEIEKDLIMQDFMDKIKGKLKEKHKGETVYIEGEYGDIFKFNF